MHQALIAIIDDHFSANKSDIPHDTCRISMECRVGSGEALCLVGMGMALKKGFKGSKSSITKRKPGETITRLNLLQVYS